MKRFIFLIIVAFFSFFGAAYNAGIKLIDVVVLLSNIYAVFYIIVIVTVVLVTVAAIGAKHGEKKPKKKKEPKKEAKHDKEETYFSPKGGEYRSEYY